jgi:hypothetical protein
VSARGAWQGMLSIARFNWPFYVAAIAVMIAAPVGLMWLSSLLPRLICAAALAGAVYFLLGSLGVSHVVYDRSDLYRWRWLDRALRGARFERVIFCHSGFDETTTALRDRFPEAEWLILDHYDAVRMTEASIRRARRLYPPTPGTVDGGFDQWPVAAEWADVVFGLLAIHELRSEAERSAWFSEARRCLRGAGRVVLVEHVRDMANFAAFGPGFLHFHSPASWQRAWESAGLQLADEFRVTPWVRVFVLTPA